MRSLSSPMALALVLAFAAAPATATQFTYVFDSHLDSSNAYSPAGRLVSQAGSGTNSAGLSVVDATAWTAVKSGSNVNITQSNLVIYDGGVGVTSNQYDNYNYCGIGGCDMHQIDNLGNSSGTIAYDFIQLTFSQAVTLVGMSRYAFPQYLGSSVVYDDDASYGSGATVADGKLGHTDRPTALTGNISIDATAIRTSSQFNQMLGNTLLSGDSTLGNGSNSDGTCKNNRILNAALVCYDTNTFGTTSSAYTASTTWWISAALFNPDNKSDAFKLYDFKVVYNDTPGPVPEPASWAMMIAGFGFTGTALRRKKAVERLAAA